MCSMANTTSAYGGLPPGQPGRQRGLLPLFHGHAVVDPLQRLLQRPPCCRQGTRREEALDVVALLGGAERREIVDQRDVAERDRDLRLELGPVLLDVRPRGLRGILG